MKSLKFLSILMGSLIISAIAFASGGIYFTDVENDIWYEDAVYNMYRLGVITGFEDDTFQPEKNANRAEIAVMLDRLYNAVTEPQGDTWAEYSNDYYNLWYPSEGTYSGEIFADGCGSGLSGDGDFTWTISCYDLDETSVEELVNTYVGNADDIRKSENEIEINGAQMLHVTQLALYDETVHYSEYLFVEDQTQLYVITGYQQNNPSFEIFYKSFELANPY